MTGYVLIEFQQIVNIKLFNLLINCDLYHLSGAI